MVLTHQIRSDQIRSKPGELNVGGDVMRDASSGQHSGKGDCRFTLHFPTRIQTSHALLCTDWLPELYPASYAEGFGGVIAVCGSPNIMNGIQKDCTLLLRLHAYFFFNGRSLNHFLLSL